MHFNTRNQNKIYGDYSIVSVFQAGDRPEWNLERHRDTMLGLLSEGFQVRQLRGEWNGVKELSIEISGIGHELAATGVACAYDQQAYIVVGGGKATVWELNPARDAYVATEVFTRYTNTPPIEGNHSAYMNGDCFKFF